MAQRKRRTRGHVIADIGVRYVEYLIAKAGYTSVQSPPGGDYGVDLYYFTYDGEGLAESGSVRVQVRATEALQFRDDGTVSIRVDCRHVRYWMQERYPVLLVIYDASKDAAFWMDVQDGIRGRQVTGKSMSISLSADQVFGVECICEVALRKNHRLASLGEPLYED
jgi:hypothetical protein